MTAIIIQLFVSGLLVGGVYALISVGLTLIFGVSRIKNFAQGDLVMVGMYVSYALNAWLGLDAYLALLVAAPLMFALGVVISVVVIRPWARQFAQIFATVGLGLVLENAALRSSARTAPRRQSCPARVLLLGPLAAGL
jgi:branched-chain amino acid transport system permease protein